MALQGLPLSHHLRWDHQDHPHIEVRSLLAPQALIATFQSHALIAPAEHLLVALTTPPHC